MGWAVWLAIPVLVTLLAAVWTWLRARPARRLSTTQSMQAHAAYLDALVETARSRVDAGPRPSEPGDGSAADHAVDHAADHAADRDGATRGD